MTSEESGAELCQYCEDAPQESTVSVSIGGAVIAPLYVCEDCEEDLTDE